MHTPRDERPRRGRRDPPRRADVRSPGARLPRPHRADGGAHPRLGLARSRSRDGAGARGGPRASGRRHVGRAAWPARRHQGHLRYGRHAHRVRDGVAPGPAAARGRDGRGAAAQGRRGDHGQDGHHRAGGVRPGQDHQPSRRAPHAGRLVERLGGRGRRMHGAARRGDADQRLADPSGVVLRRLRLQALARRDLPPRRAQAVAHARSRRRVRALGRGRRPRRPRTLRARRRRSRTPRRNPPSSSRRGGKVRSPGRRGSPSRRRRSGRRPSALRRKRSCSSRRSGATW